MWWNMIYAFLKVGILGFGGGPSSIPLMHKEVVGTYRWMEDDEFGDILAIGNALPGPILTKMAGYIGYRLKGVAGAVVALAITTLPTIAGMVLLFALLGSFQGSPRVEGMTQAVQPIVGVMLGAMAYGMLAKSRKKLGTWITVVAAAAFAALMSWLNLHPAILILALLILGASFAKPLSFKKLAKKGERQS